MPACPSPTLLEKDGEEIGPFDLTTKPDENAGVRHHKRECRKNGYAHRGFDYHLTGLYEGGMTI